MTNGWITNAITWSTFYINSEKKTTHQLTSNESTWPEYVPCFHWTIYNIDAFYCWIYYTSFNYYLQTGHLLAACTLANTRFCSYGKWQVIVGISYCHLFLNSAQKPWIFYLVNKCVFRVLNSSVFPFSGLVLNSGLYLSTVTSKRSRNSFWIVLMMPTPLEHLNAKHLQTQLLPSCLQTNSVKIQTNFPSSSVFHHQSYMNQSTPSFQLKLFFKLSRWISPHDFHCE